MGTLHSTIYIGTLDPLGYNIGVLEAWAGCKRLQG